MLMNGGRVEQLGSPDDLYFRPVSQFVADFIGQSTMIDAEIVQTGEVSTATLSGGGSCRLASTGLRKGQNGKIVLRPEVLRLVSPSQPREGYNLLLGRHLDTLVTGSTIKHFVELDGGVEIVVQELTTPEAKTRKKTGKVGVEWPFTAGTFLEN